MPNIAKAFANKKTVVSGALLVALHSMTLNATAQAMQSGQAAQSPSTEQIMQMYSAGNYKAFAKLGSERLRAEPDVFLFDGMGTAHPRRMGIASHMGLWLERPTVGVGKTRLVGTNAPLAEEKGAQVPLVHRGQTIGAVVRTRTAKHPLFISPGHLADIPSAVALVLTCAPKFRLPEPIRLAHRAAGDF